MSQFVVSLHVCDNQYQQLVQTDSHEIVFVDKEACSTSPLLRMEVIDDDRVRISNLSELPFYSCEEIVESGAAIELSLPFRLESGVATVFAFRALNRELFYSRCERIPSGLGQRTRHAPTDESPAAASNLPVVELTRSPSPATLSRWFATLALIQRQASCSDAFYRESVTALVNPGGLETSMLLERGDSGWSIKHFEAVNAQNAVVLSSRVGRTGFSAA